MMRKKFFLALLVVCLMMAGTVECEESNLLNHTVVPVWLVGMPLNGTTIPADCQDTLVKLVEIAAARPDITFVINGLCSVEGDENYNLVLALRRAEAIKFFLVSKGVEPGRIRTIGLGRVEATNRADVRGVLLEIIYIPRSIRVDISAIEAVRLSANAAADRAEAAEVKAKAWAAEAKSQADRATAQAGKAVQAKTEAKDARDSAWAGAKAAWQVDNAATGRLIVVEQRLDNLEAVSEFIIISDTEAKTTGLMPSPVEPETEPPLSTPTPTQLLLSAGYNNISAELKKGLVGFKVAIGTAILGDEEEKWWGYGASIYPTEKWRISLLATNWKFQDDKVITMDGQVTYHLLDRNPVSIYVGLNVGWTPTFESEYRNGNMAEFEGVRIGLPIWASVPLSDKAELHLGYSPLSTKISGASKVSSGKADTTWLSHHVRFVVSCELDL